MPESFPTTPRAPRAVQVGALVIALAAIALAARTTFTSSAWVGRVFPGFMLLDNRVVASVGLGHWSGAAVRGLYQSEVLAIDRTPVGSAAEARALVATRTPGTPILYTLRQGDIEREVVIVAQRFTMRDWLLLFGPFLLNGAVFLAGGLVVWVLRPRAPVAWALLAVGVVMGCFCFTVLDLYGPATFFRLHVVAETLLPATMWHLSFLFPEPSPLARFLLVPYAVSLAIALPYELFLYRPAIYSRVLSADMLHLGVVAIFFCARLILAYRKGTSLLVRQRVRVITLGALFGFAAPAFVLPFAALMGGSAAMNAAGYTPFVFALSLAYAIAKHDLFDIDAMVKRGAYYLVLTGGVGAAYVAAVLAFNYVLRAGAHTDSVAFPLLFTLAVLLFFNPLRTRLQAFVDRVFFGTRYDSARVLAEVGAKLASALTRDHVARLVRDCVAGAIPNARTRLFVANAETDQLGEVGGDGAVPAQVAARLGEGRLIAAFDPQELYVDTASHEVVRAGLGRLEAEIAVPMQFQGRLVGALTTGAKRAGFYTAADAEFLRALAHETAIALQNAISYEALVELNARLEERVRERTAQIEAANGELASAYRELQNTQVQLVQSEKMASLGRLVAGVAHEINNPVSFISTNVAPLRRRLEKAAALAPAEVEHLLREADDIVAIMARGAERTTRIVKDLRSFSRLDEAVRKPTDLHEGLDVTLRLLEARWRDRIAIHRDYGELPRVECDSGQVNQVFMNVLANACEAITGEGNIWVATRADDGAVTVTIRDDGDGIAPDVVGRIFDPFFTTKDVGSGTGLGLAISHGIMTAHDGRIEVESTVGQGTVFRIILPAETERLDSAQRRSG